MDVSVCRRAAWAGGWCLSHLIILDGAFSSAISPLMLTEHYGWVHQMVFAGVTLLNSTVKPTAQGLVTTDFTSLNKYLTAHTLCKALEQEHTEPRRCFGSELALTAH